jgi:hypothetical protein
VIVNLAKLIETLKDLKETRRLSSESEAMIKPFIGLQSELIFSFIESSSTFGSRLGEEFKSGMTVIAQFEDTGLECSILFPKAEIEWVKSLTKDEKFTLYVTVIELDNLYQRVVFGKSTKDEHEPVQNDQPSVISSTDDSVSEIQEVDLMDSLEAEVSDAQKIGESKLSSAEEEPSIQESAITHELDTVEAEVIKGPGAETPFNEVSSLPSDEYPETEKESAITQDSVGQVKPILGDHREVSRASDQAKKQAISSPVQVQETRENIQPPPLSQSSAKKELSKDMQPPPLPKSSRGPVKIDHHYLEELRNKRYEFGVTSLTEKEKAALAQDLKTNADSRTKELKKTQAFAKKAGRLFLGIVLITFSLNSCTQGNSTFGLILLGFSVYLLFPYIKEILDEQA